ncbi:hypothetical protein VP01_1905g4, partial [Puccinia sorghi]
VKVAKDPDGYCKLQSHVPEQKTFIGKQFYLVSGPLFDEVSFPFISNFANLPHKNNDYSPFTSFMWIPIEQTTGNLVEENFEVKGGEFVFPNDSCGINFSGFNCIVC